MKQLSQIIVFSIFGVGAVQIILATGALIILLQLLTNKIAGARSRWGIKKRKRAVDDSMWSIE